MSLPVFTSLKRRFIQTLASSYVAGPELGDALELCRRAARNGWCSTICPWNGPGDRPRQVMERYTGALAAIRRDNLGCYLSIKADALAYDAVLLREVLARGQANGVRVHFDAQAPESAEPVFAALESALRSFTNVGCTLPGRWRRSLRDAERAIEWGIPVRVVKGQWADPSDPARDPAAGFREVVQRLAGRAAAVAVATHDVPLAAHCIRGLQDAGTCVELEQLYGLPLRSTGLAAAHGIPVRIYIAYGQAWLPYCLSHVRKRPVVAAWVMRDLLLGRRGKLPTA